MNSRFNASDLIPSRRVFEGGNIRRMTRDNPPRRYIATIKHGSSHARSYPAGKCFEPRLSSGITLAGCIRPTRTYVRSSEGARSPLVPQRSTVTKRAGETRRLDRGICTRRWREYHDMACETRRGEARRRGIFLLPPSAAVCARVHTEKGREIVSPPPSPPLPLFTPARVALMDTGFGIALLRSRNAWRS